MSERNFYLSRIACEKWYVKFFFQSDMRFSKCVQFMLGSRRGLDLIKKFRGFESPSWVCTLGSSLILFWDSFFMFISTKLKFKQLGYKRYGFMKLRERRIASPSRILGFFLAATYIFCFNMSIQLRSEMYTNHGTARGLSKVT